ncbi:MAG: LysR family transcriptional regulator [Actinomycetota bacterium]|nr:LysR family transcriptional regulator [Actinomycetota bacterium]
MLDPHRLTVFRSVVASGSISGAAQLLGYTPSAVSQQITTLQKETGLVLLDRVGRGVEPTPAGRRLADEAEGVLAQLSALDTTVTNMRAGRSARLTINAFASVGTHWMPHVVAALTKEFPETSIRMRLEEQLASLGPTRPDLAVLVKFKGEQQFAGYHEHELVTEPYVVVLPADHDLADRRSLRLVDLAELAWVDNDVHRGPCRAATMAACRAAGFAPKFVVETTDYPSALAFVAQGIGLTVIPRLGSRSLPQGTVAVAIDEPTPRRMVAVQVKDTVAQTRVVQRALALLREQAGR